MKETEIKWTKERNEIKNRVVEHLGTCYHFTRKDWEICLDTIDSVFFFEEEIEEELKKQEQSQENKNQKTTTCKDCAVKISTNRRKTGSLDILNKNRRLRNESS